MILRWSLEVRLEEIYFMKKWAISIGRQGIRMVFLVAAVSIVTFLLMKASPVDPLQANVGQAALGSLSPEQVEKLEEYWGVNTPPLEQYLSWAKDFIRGDMGTSLLYRQPVTEVIGVKLSNSLSCNLQYSYFLACPSSFNGFWRMAEDFTHWSQCAYRCRSLRCYFSGSGASCDPSRCYPEHYGRVQYCPPHPGKNDRYYGK